MTTVNSTSGAENVAIDLGQIQFDRSVSSGAAPLAADLEEAAIELNLVADSYTHLTLQTT